jgi:uncharacterized protein (TIGR02466 family)
MKNQLHPLFAYPLVICGDIYAFSDAENEYFVGLEMIDNVGNSMSKDDRVLDSEVLSKLKQFIDDRIFMYKKELLRIGDDNQIYVTQSWINRARPDQYHPRHKHPNSLISGVMYLDDNADRGLSPIRFHRSHEMFPLEFKYEELTDFNATSKEFEPKQGMLVLFPSLLEHDVGQNKSDRIRTSLSFNTYVRGKVGGRKQLTEVDIR